MLELMSIIGDIMTTEEKLGPGHNQIKIGLVLFLVGAGYGGLATTGGTIEIGDIFWSGLMMIGGAMIVLLGISFGSGFGLEGTSADLSDTSHLQSALDELNEKLTKITEKMSSDADDSSDEDSSSDDSSDED